MAGCDEIRVPNVGREHLASFLEKGAQMGFPDLAGQGDSGEVSHSGVTVRWAYLPEQRVLTVQCTQKPMLLPCTMINTRLQDVLASVMKQDTIKEQA